MTTYEKIKMLCENAGFSVSSIGEKISGLSVNKASITGWKNGSKPRPKKIKAIADYFGVTVDYLINDEQRSTEKTIYMDFHNGIPDKTIPFPSQKRIPLLGSITCVDPILAEENIEDYITSPDMLRTDFALRCRGDSMINARIYNNDIVYIRQQPDVENGEIAAVLIGNETTLKRVYHYSDTLVLRAENPAVAELIYTKEQLNDIRILGKAVAIFGAVM